MIVNPGTKLGSNQYRRRSLRDGGSKIRIRSAYYLRLFLSSAQVYRGRKASADVPALW